jgi:hypothetical protein
MVVQAGEAKLISQDLSVQVADYNSGEWDLLRSNLTTLVGYWTFDDKSDSVVDGRGASHGTRQRARRVAGLIGEGALQSDGTPGQMAEIVSPGNSVWAFTKAVSVEAVFTTSWTGLPSDTDFLVRRFDGDSLTFSLALENDPHGKSAGPALAFFVNTDQGRQVLAMPLDGKSGRPTLNDVTNGRAHHVAATFNGDTGEMVLYFDGQQRAKRTMSFPIMLNDGVQAALEGRSDPAVNDPFNGTIDEIALYRVALAADEIARHWANVRHGRSYVNQH